MSLRRLGRLLVLLFACALPAEKIAAGSNGSGPPASSLRRVLQPPEGTVSTASLPRVEIAEETRTVLWRAPRRVLEVERGVSVAEELTLSPSLSLSPEDFPMRLEGWVSVRSESLPGAAANPWEGARVRLPLRSVVVDSVTAAREKRIALAEPPPPNLASQRGLLTVIGWPLGTATVVERTTAPLEVGASDVLRFGYGVEEAAWTEGFAPVLFEVTAIGADGQEKRIFERRLDPVLDSRDRRWFDASVPLAALADGVKQFRFSAQALAAEGADPPRSLPVFSNPELVRRNAAPPTRLNLILVSLDTLRAKSVGAYGSRRDTTPKLDERMAKAGALVRQAVAPVPLTPPSHMTMLTGLEPCVHGVVDRDKILAPEHATLAEILRGAGYDTAAVTEDAYVVAGAGFARGFDAYFEERSDEESAPGFAAQTFATAERWLLDRPTQPFFLFIHTYQVHAPYSPPRGYRSFFSEVLLKKPDLDDLLRDYEREVRYTDDLFAGFLDFLEANGLAERTVVVVTSDHGETFDEFIVGGHGFGLKDSELLVPLLIRAPGVVPAGTVVEPQVGLVDLTPTLLDLLGVPAAVDMQGRSFAPLLRGAPGSFTEQPIVSSSAGSFSQSVRTSRYKFLSSSKEDLSDRLYDLPADPTERKDVIGERPDDAKAARQALTDHRERCEAWKASHPTSKGVDSLFEHRPGWLVNRDEITQKLRSLGYVE
jgi:arylsulfatase A-like enzyme